MFFLYSLFFSVQDNPLLAQSAAVELCLPSPIWLKYQWQLSPALGSAELYFVVYTVVFNGSAEQSHLLKLPEDLLKQEISKPLAINFYQSRLK